MSSAETETAAEEAPAADEVREQLLATLREALGDDLVGSEIRHRDLWVRVRPEAWHKAAEVCHDRLSCDYFCFLSGIDWMPAPTPNPEEAAAETDISGGDDEAPATDEAEEATETAAEETPPADEVEGWQTGYAGGESRFQVFARFESTRKHHGVTVKADLDEEAPAVASIADVYRGADWHERETWEMYGFDFTGHPNLSHLYLPGEFEGFPLRKDFPLLAREVKPWPGLVDVEPIPADVEAALDAKLSADDAGSGGES